MLKDQWIDGYYATARFALNSLTGSGYSLYDKENPNGDELDLIYTTNDQIWGKSRISGEEYRLVYDGIDTVRIYWKDTSWYENADEYLILKKVKDYYEEDYRNQNQNDSSDSVG